MTFTSLEFLLFVAAGFAGLAVKAWREHRDMLRRRASLLDAAAGLFHEAKLSIRPDGFPALDGHLADGRRVAIDIIADTLVPRRLAQLWLKLTIREPAARSRPTIGALARPTGAEFYSLVHEMPDWMAPPFQSEFPLLMRGQDASTDEIERSGAVFRSLFSDPGLKEAAITPRGIRIVRQIAQGDYGAHVLFRQVRFPVDQVSPDLVRKVLADAALLDAVFDSRPASVQPERKVA